jgi:hypothetical protein
MRAVSIGAIGSMAFMGFFASPGRLIASAGTNHSRGAYGGRLSSLHVAEEMDQPTLPREGRRVFSGKHVNTFESTNWSGYAGLSATALEGAQGSWIVPTAATTSGPDLYSSSWVGLDGANDSWLIQTGTDEDSSATGRSYDPWFEIITPSNVAPSELIGATVEPGDSMLANIEQVASGVWQIYLADSTQNWYFQQDFAYAGPGTSSEWIEEAPTVDGQQSSPANWGTVHFAGTGVDEAGTWYTTGMTASNAIDLVDADGNVLAGPGPISAPAAGGQAFADVFGPPAPHITPPPPPKPKITRPSVPRGVTRQAKHLAIRLHWSRPAATGGQPISRYTIDEYRGTKLFMALHSTTTSITAGKLSHSWRYSFTVTASNKSYSSAPTGRTAPLRPLK